mgnify:CR=1 FL=1
MKRLLFPLIAALAFPIASKADFFSRSLAVGAQAAAECFSERGFIKRSEIESITNETLNDFGIYNVSSWLRTSKAKKAVSITKRYLDNNCEVDPVYQMELGEKIVPYVLN